jgi:FtsH-binding integral membrane protein
MTQLYKSNWVAIGLLLTGVLLVLVSVVGYIFNPRLFSSFSWLVFGVIISLAGYILYNIKKIFDEIKSSEN